MTDQLNSHFLNLYSIALSDFQFDEREIAALYKIGEERGVPKNDIDTILLNPAKVKFSYPDTVTQKIEYLYDYARMIVADGIIANEERSILNKFCRKFEFQEENISSIIELLLEAANNQVPTTELLNFVNSNN